MLLPVEDALARVLKSAKKTDIIERSLQEADGYTLAKDIAAARTQPPFAASAMDGYAVIHTDLALEKPLKVIGEAAAGHQFSGTVKAGECVRIFTGAPMPEGTDTVLIQEDATRLDNQITPIDIPSHGLFVRPAGMDFCQGDVLLKAGDCLNFQTLSLAAAMNHPTLPVHQKPKVGIISNGDELVFPGQKPKDDQIIASNAFGIASLVKAQGAEAVDFGIAGDRIEDIIAAFKKAEDAGCDVLVTLGGASVGDHDLIKPALATKGIELDFWKIAMRPGKPFMFGSMSDILMLGMPGNPVSSLVCALLFLKPLLLAMQGRDASYPLDKGVLETPLAKNSHRQAYLRGHATKQDGKWHVRAFKQQDSSILSVLSQANCLIIRPPHAEAAEMNETCDIFWL